MRQMSPRRRAQGNTASRAAVGPVAGKVSAKHCQLVVQIAVPTVRYGVILAVHEGQAALFQRQHVVSLPCCLMVSTGVEMWLGWTGWPNSAWLGPVAASAFWGSATLLPALCLRRPLSMRLVFAQGPGGVPKSVGWAGNTDGTPC